MREALAKPVTVPHSYCTRDSHAAWAKVPLEWLRNTRRHREADDGYRLMYLGECRQCMSTLSLDLGISREPNADYERVMADESLAEELIK